MHSGALDCLVLSLLTGTSVRSRVAGSWQMTRKKLDFRGQAFKDVLGFTFRHWAQQPWRVVVIAALVLLLGTGGRTHADVRRTSRRRDRVRRRPPSAVAWHAAITAFCVLGALGLGATLLRQGVYFNIIRLTLKMMSEIAANAFHRVQRFSTDWHANSFAGSTVRKITRGMWALDLLNDTLLIALLPSLVMLVGATASARLALADDGRGRRHRLAAVYRGDRGHVARLRRAGRAPRECVGHPHGRRARRRGQLQRCGQGVRRRRTRRSAACARDRQVASPHAPHMDARHDQRRRPGRHAGGDPGRHPRRGAAVVGARRGERRRHHLRADHVLHAARLSARRRHAHPQPATLGQRHGRTRVAGTPAARHRGPSRRGPDRDRQRRDPLRARHVPLRRARHAALRQLLACASRRASVSGWSGIRARARRRSSS